MLRRMVQHCESHGSTYGGLISQTRCSNAVFICPFCFLFFVLKSLLDRFEVTRSIGLRLTELFLHPLPGSGSWPPALEPPSVDLLCRLELLLKQVYA